MQKIVIIGGGASGMVAAIYAANSKNQVTIIERNPDCGKKITLTGNGRCNYWNEDQTLTHYHSTTPEYLSEILTFQNQTEILSFFDHIGIIPKIKNGYYYPFSNQATSIQEALKREVTKKNIQIISNTYITEIIKKQNTFYINPQKDNIIADKIIIATGSRACPKTGSDGSGYRLATSLGHSLQTVLPALVALEAKDENLKLWDGIRCDATIHLIENNHEIAQETGEIQLTEYGISGICTFNISYLVSQGLNQKKQEMIKINFIPWLDNNDIAQTMLFLEKRNQTLHNCPLDALLDGFLNYKLVHFLLKKCHLKKDDTWNSLPFNDQKKLSQMITNYPLEIIATKEFDKAQVCKGGIPLLEISPLTMESQKVKNLFFAGEILDVDGDCGGYNLGFAWISGMIAGKSARGGNNDSN